MQRILVTAGEPAGIGPELCLHLAHHNWQDYELVVIADRHMLAERAHQLNMAITITDVSLQQPCCANTQGHLKVCHLPMLAPCQTGTLNAQNSAYVLASLDLATDACLAGDAAAMVTAPVHKGVINDGGIHFTGHTEYLQARCDAEQVVMMLTCDAMRVALATTHLPLTDVAEAITQDGLISVLRIVNKALDERYQIASPCIYVCGLNPHAGEGGHLGSEEITTITPALDTLRSQGINVIGPLPADTIFNPIYLQEADCVLAMYHDQGLPVLKYAGFGDAVNVTLGLPIVRTSVDHGTALDIAGNGTASPSSLVAAVQAAVAMTQPLKDLDT